MAYSRSACLPLGLLLCCFACNDSRLKGRGDLDILPADDMAEAGPGGCQLSGITHQLSNLTGQHAYPRIASNGIGYVVAWVSGIAGSPPTFRIDATLIDGAGNKMGPNLPMSPQAIAESDPPSLAPISGGTSIAWTRRLGTATDIVLSTLDASGQKLDSSGLACDPADAGCGIFPITSSGTARSAYLERPYGDRHLEGPTENQLGVAFVDSRNYPCGTLGCSMFDDIFWKRVQTNGTELLFETKLTTTSNSIFAGPRLAFDGAHQGVVWRDATAGTSTNLDFTTINPLGQLDSAVQKIGSVSGTNATSTPDLVWSGAEYAIVSASGTDATAAVLFQRQSPTGVSTLAPKSVTFEGSACAPSVAYDGSSYGIVYQLDCGNVGSELAFIRVDADGTRRSLDGGSCGDSVDPACGRLLFASADASGGASRPAVVYGGDRSFAIVWMQGPEGANLDPTAPLDVYFQRVTCQ